MKTPPRSISLHLAYYTTRKGFTLIEMLVSLFVFGLAISGVIRTVTSSFSSYRVNRAVQYDVETAQHTMNIMAKELRTSSVVSAAESSNLSNFLIIRRDNVSSYRIKRAALEIDSAASQEGLLGMHWDGTLASFTTISTGTVHGVVSGDPIGSTCGRHRPRVGKVTVSLRIAKDATHQARIQTTVSLRDFGNIGL